MKAQVTAQMREVTAMAVTQDALADTLAPMVSDLGLTLHDVEFQRNLIRVTLYESGGISIESLTAANRLISDYLDEHEPFEGRYTLEVSSPGVERKLRNERHFAAAIGEQIYVKTVPDVVAVPDRRIEGELIEAAHDGIVIAPADGEPVSLQYDQIDRARTIYDWGPTSKPSPSRGGTPRGKRRSAPTASERVTTP